MRIQTRLVLAAAAAMAAAPATTQNLNIDFGTYFSTPDPAFAGAADQPGMWGAAGLGVTAGLPDLAGTATHVSVTVTADEGGGWWSDCDGDVRALIADNFFAVGREWSVVLSGLTNGVYRVWLYGPVHPAVATGAMTVAGVAAPGVSGDHCGVVGGITYTTAQVAVSDRTLTITGLPPAQGTPYAGLAGLQLSRVPPHRLRRVLDGTRVR